MEVLGESVINIAAYLLSPFAAMLVITWLISLFRRG